MVRSKSDKSVPRESVRLRRSRDHKNLLGRSKSRERKKIRGTPLFPTDLKIEIAKFQLTDYAQQFFRQQRTLFKRKIPMEKALEHTKTIPHRSLLLVTSDELNKEAVDMFKLILEYMGDRKSYFFFIKEEVNEMDLALAIMKRAVDNPQLRDELYVQLMKQTTKNPSEKSEEKGWELVCMTLEIYLQPSPNLEAYLNTYLLHVKDTHPSPRMAQFASYCQERLLLLTSKPRAPVLPSIATLLQAREAPFLKSVFRSSLQQMMEYQKETHPDLNIPVVLKTLIDMIISAGGLTSVGIFRVAAPATEISELRRQLEETRGDFIPVMDPNIPACLLKVWLAEIRFPVIPRQFYDRITTHCRDWPKLKEIIEEFPTIHRHVLFYIINFLQRVAIEDNKMDTKNIAIVISPTMCRCPGNDAFLVMKQTMVESEFAVCLLENLPSENPVFLKDCK